MKIIKKNIFTAILLLVILSVNYYWFFVLTADTRPILVIDSIAGLNFILIFLVGNRVPLAKNFFIGTNYLIFLLAMAFIRALLTSN